MAALGTGYKQALAITVLTGTGCKVDPRVSQGLFALSWKEMFTLKALSTSSNTIEIPLRCGNIQGRGQTEKESNMIESKCCRTCLQVKPISNFHKKLDSQSLHCKDCANAKRRLNYVDNRELELIRAATYRANNPELMRQKRLAWKRANSQKNVASVVAYQRRNPEKRAKATKKYREANKDRYNVWSQQRQAKLKNCKTYQVSNKEINRLYSSACVSCGKNKDQTIDHIIPIDLGGSHGIGNLQTLCLSCNSSKRNRVMTVWKKSLGKLTC
jgi:5-methylcytosine-specific restriction endonuclease McrA